MAASQEDTQWFRSVQEAFADQKLRQQIWAAASQQPATLPTLFEDIARYVLSLRGSELAVEPAPASKKRKLEDSSSSQINGRNLPPSAFTTSTMAFECPDVSFQIPARKKLKLQLFTDAKDRQKNEIWLLDSKTNSIEYICPAHQIDQAFCLPVPEKQQRQCNFAIIPKPGAVTAEGTPAEQILFTMNEQAPSAVSTLEDAVGEGDTYVTVTQRALTKLLAPYGKKVVVPSEKEFASSIPQSHRKGEKAYHVKAHRGSKEGYLFFLPNGIVFGFKKPLAFFSLPAVESISYTSVLQRTFNLVIAALDHETSNSDSDAGQAKEVEFSMLDQEDFAGIDTYIKRHGLNDASMAAQRRAKAYNVNKEKKAEVNGSGEGEGGGVEDEQSELQKAEQQLQDEEDEEEEDYEASGGESDGEGEDSEGEEDGEEYDEEGEEEEEAE